MSSSARRGAAVATGVGVAVVLATALAGCGSADPAGVVGVGIDADGGYVGLIRLCDEGRTFTHAAFARDGETATDATISWIGRSVEPITFFRTDLDPPDNFVVERTGPVADGVEYTFRVSGDDLDLSGATVDVARLDQLEPSQVMAPDGSVLDVDEFLAVACG